MKNRGTWLVCTVAAVLAVGVLAAPDARAACSSFITFDSGDFNFSYNYVVQGVANHSLAGTNGGGLAIGHFWQPGARPGQNEGGYQVVDTANPNCLQNGNSAWLCNYNTSLYGWYLRGNLTNGGVVGCPGTPSTISGGGCATTCNVSSCANDAVAPGVGCELIIVVLDKATDESDASYAVARPTFDFTTPSFALDPTNTSYTNLVMQPIPKPFVNASGRINPTTVSLDLQLADIAPGFQGRGVGPGAAVNKSAHATITGYNLCTQERLDTAAPPDRDVSDGWSCASAGTAVPGGLTINGRTETCTSAGNHRYLATQLVFADGYVSEYVSRAVRIECDPNIAEPIILEQRRPRRPGVEQKADPRPTPKKIR